nr:MAG TPA: Transcription initiation factor IIE, alpha FINGER, Transcription [Bacteriophage sp.]
MIKILSPGTKKEAECPSCGALLSYDISDIQKSSHSITETSSAFWLSSKGTTYIVCPQCNNKIILSATR